LSEIEITLPTVTYGNVKVRATPEELGLHSIDDAYELGAATAVYLNLFSQGFKVGSQMDVSAPVSASEGDVGAQAQEWLDKGLGGVTELPGGDIVGHEGTATQAPWVEVVDAKPKPWETENLPPEAVVTAPAVLDAAW